VVISDSTISLESIDQLDLIGPIESQQDYISFEYGSDEEEIDISLY
jgi:hypothetical protein